MESQFEILDAFVDGERVDAAALKRALADAEGRDYLVHAWLLREAVQEDIAHESAAPPAPIRARGPRAWMFAAALVLCVAGGYAIGYRAGGVLAPPSGTPAPGNNVTPTTVSVPATKSFPVPAPTRVIQVDFTTVAAAGSGGE